MSDTPRTDAVRDAFRVMCRKHYQTGMSESELRDLAKGIESSYEAAADLAESLERELAAERDAHNATANNLGKALTRAENAEAECERWKRDQLERELAAVTEERDALAAAMPSEGADAALAYAAEKTLREKAEAECERLRDDAERYRKCRRNDGFYFSSDRMTDDEIDARIDGMDDAARKP